MIWKFIKICLVVSFLLLILVPSVLYVRAIDLSKSYTASVIELPLYNNTIEDGVYRLKANGMQFKTRLAGFQNKADNVIFLHGFPETSKIWEPTMEAC